MFQNLPRQLESYPVSTPPALPFTLEDLPDAAALRAHPLRYCADQTIPETELWQVVVAELWPFLLTSTLVTLGVHLLALLPAGVAWLSAAVVGVVSATAHFYFAAQRSFVTFLTRLLVWPLFWLGAYWVTTTWLVARQAASVVLTLLALGLLFGLCFAAHPLRFWWDYLFCAPWLTTPTLRRQWDIILSTGAARRKWLALVLLRNLAFGGALLFVVLVTAGNSTRRAILLLFLLGLLFADGCRPQVLRAGRRVLAHYLTYPDLPLPGNFLPQATLRQRRWYLGATFITLQLALSTGLTLYVPSELLTAAAPPRVQPSPAPTASAPSKRQRQRKPKATPLPSPAVTPLPTPPPPNENTYVGVQKFVQATWDAKTISLQGAFDFLLFPLCCAFCLPPLLFLAALRGFLLEAERLAAHLTTLDGRESRTEWQWYVDRLHGELDESEVFDES